MTSEITFDLDNSSPTADVMAVLFPAILRRQGLLKGKFLKGTSFKDETGHTDLKVTNVSPSGAIAELDEYNAQLENIQVLAVKVATQNLTQATQNFVQKNYVEFKDATSENLPTSATLVENESAVLHTFPTPFSTGNMKSLEMKLLADQKVTLTLYVVMPDAVSAPDSSTLPPLT